MIIAPVGSSRIVSGRSIAIVAEGPSPGRTPITVPSTTPSTHMPSAPGVVATWNPCIKLPRMSMARADRSEEQSSRKGELQEVREDAVEERGAQDRDRDRLALRAARHDGDDEPREERERHGEAEDAHERDAPDERGPAGERARHVGPVDAGRLPRPPR